MSNLNGGNANLDNVSTADLEAELNFRKYKPQAYPCRHIRTSGCEQPVYRIKGSPDLWVESQTGRKFVSDGRTLRLRIYVDYEGLAEMLQHDGVPKDLVHLAVDKHKSGEDERPWIDLLKRKGLI